MPRRSTTVEALRARAVLLDRQIREASAKRRERDAANEKRRRLVAGEVALEYAAANRGSSFALTLTNLIDAGTRSQADRKLFGLSSTEAPLEKRPAATAEPAS